MLRGLATILRAAGAAWRATGRAIATVGGILAVPFVWIYRHVLTPVGHAIRAVWRAFVVRPARAVRRQVAAGTASVRTAWMQVRQQVSVLFGRAR